MFKAIKDMTFKAIKYRHLPETLETETEVISRFMSRKASRGWASLSVCKITSSILMRCYEQHCFEVLPTKQ